MFFFFFLLQLKIGTTVNIVLITLILVSVVAYGFCTFFSGFWAFFPTFLNSNTRKTKYNFPNHLILNKPSKLLSARTDLLQLTMMATLHHSGKTGNYFFMFRLTKSWLPEIYLRCWQTLVLACQYLCSPVNSKTDTIKADLLLVKSGVSFERVYGKSV